jgi:hypothetical protein
MNLLELIENHSTEQACKQAFKAHRELLGVTCKECQCTRQRRDKQKNLWHCKKCGFRTTLKSGTVLQHSKMSFKIWFQVVAFMISTKKGFSAKEVQRLTNHSRYEPIWYMMHKIRKQMGKNVIYFDAFEHLISGKIESIKEGRNTVAKEIQIETLTLDRSNIETTHQKIKALKMKVVKCDSENEKTNLNKLKSNGDYPESKNSERKKSPKTSPRFAYKCLENAHRIIYGIHHHVESDYLQNYLDEFCFKFNRKEFQHLVHDELWQYLIVPEWKTCG